MLYDVFIRHASADKAGFVSPLVTALSEANVEVWYDERTLRLGDSIRRTIEPQCRLSRSMSALIHLIRDKAKKGWSEKDFADMRLLIAASIPQLGGTASTFLLKPSLKVDEMNAQLSPILEQTIYSVAYLYLMTWKSVYKWTKRVGGKSFFCHFSKLIEARVLESWKLMSMNQVFSSGFFLREVVG
jgi:hypothetical protein